MLQDESVKGQSSGSGIDRHKVGEIPEATPYFPAYIGVGRHPIIIIENDPYYLLE